LKAVWEFASKNWGSIASVLGLIISAMTLLVARKAKASADAAKREVHRRNRAEDLQDAHTKSHQVGLFIRDNKWDIVFLRAQEIVTACSMILRRWNADLSETSKGQIVLARAQAGSIVKVAMRANLAPPGRQEVLNISAAQRRLNELLSSEWGESLRAIESSEEKDE
jgi:hypothetical protein